MNTAPDRGRRRTLDLVRSSKSIVVDSAHTIPSVHDSAVMARAIACHMTSTKPRNRSPATGLTSDSGRRAGRCRTRPRSTSTPGSELRCANTKPMSDRPITFSSPTGGPLALSRPSRIVGEPGSRTVEEQSEGYAKAKLKWVSNAEPLPLSLREYRADHAVHERRDPNPRSREVLHLPPSRDLQGMDACAAVVPVGHRHAPSAESRRPARVPDQCGHQTRRPR